MILISKRLNDLLACAAGIRAPRLPRRFDKEAQIHRLFVWVGGHFPPDRVHRSGELMLYGCEREKAKLCADVRASNLIIILIDARCSIN